MQHIATLGIDAAKNIFQLHGVDAHGKVVLKKRLVRTKVLAFVAGLAPCLIGLEASGSAHYWAREFTKLGHTVQLISPQLVKPYVQGHKNDPKDAAGICEAVGRRTCGSSRSSRWTSKICKPCTAFGSARSRPGRPWSTRSGGCWRSMAWSYPRAWPRCARSCRSSWKRRRMA